MKRYPEKLEELLEDRRHLSVQRYLRKIYIDPMIGGAEWGLVHAPAGGVVGVYSTSKQLPLRKSTKSQRSDNEWRFVYEQPSSQLNAQTGSESTVGSTH